MAQEHRKGAGVTSKEAEQLETTVISGRLLQTLQDQHTQLLEACKEAETALIGITPASVAWDKCRKAIEMCAEAEKRKGKE